VPKASAAGRSRLSGLRNQSLGKEIKERYARKKLHTSFASVCSMKMIVNVQSFAIQDEPEGGRLFPIQVVDCACAGVTDAKNLARLLLIRQELSDMFLER